jgi:SNF2 family DNA or RNA helicase
LSAVYVCRKCGRTHSKQEFTDSRFCRNCGTFLFRQGDDTGSITDNRHEEVETAFQGRGNDLTRFFSEKIPRKGNRSKTERVGVNRNRKQEDSVQYTRRGSFITYSDPNNIRGLIQREQYSYLEKFRLNLAAQEIKRIGTIDKLISMDVLRTKIDAHPYQMKVALSVLQEMNVNAILADEVGLGKTIEAGIIMKELLVRGIVNTVLIIVPRSLLRQWKTEMREKFGENFIIANDRKEFIDFESDDKIICSSGLLIHRYKEISNRKWDLLIIDEAHTYRNLRSKGRTHLVEIPRSYLLLLTATPLCNKLTDLYSLVDLVYPGRLETERSFVSRYAADAKFRTIRSDMVHELRSTLHEVMCRTRRIETNIPFTRRYVESRRVEANSQESEFIDKATQYLKDIGNNRFETIEQLKAQNPLRRISESQSRSILIFQAISLQQSLSSSPSAAIETLQKRYSAYPSERSAISELIECARKTKSSKLELLQRVLKETEDEQALVFCLRKATTARIKETLDNAFGKTGIYTGDMSSSQRENAIAEFKAGNIRYLIATDAAAEGLNLQHCNVMFNYDLHWNPMKIEQRIGRIHRLGQERDVTIFNLSIKDTIDDYVLHILYQKIDLFNITIGGMETILAEVKEGVEDIQKTIMEIVLRSKTRIDIKGELEKLSQDFLYAKKKQELAEKFTKGVLD